MGKHVLILGGGFGGITAALALRRGLKTNHKVTLVDKHRFFFMGLSKLWILNGTEQVGYEQGDRRLLTKHDVEFLQGEVEAIHAKEGDVQVGDRKILFDYLIVALGADYSETAPPGFKSHAKNLYSESGCVEIRDALRSLDNGTVTILVSDLPFKCPPAPYEASMIIDDVLEKRGVRDRVKVQIVTPEPQPLAALGPEAGRLVTGLLEDRGITYLPSEKVKEIRPGSILTESGKELPHDLLAAIPIHVVPEVLRKSELVDQSGWIPVEPKTMASAYPNVFAIGDCAGTKIPKGTLLPRAGILAEGQGKVVAANLIHEIDGSGKSVELRGQGSLFRGSGRW